jgi:hypothetical protein
MIQIGITNQPVLEIKAENGQIVLNLPTPKSLVAVNGKKNNGNAAKLSLRTNISEAKDL